MADLADKAVESEERDLADALAVRKPAGPPPCGVCYWCGEPLKGERRFCSEDCRDDWQYAEDRK